MQRHLTHSGVLYTGAGVEGSTSLSKMKELLKDLIIKTKLFFHLYAHYQHQHDKVQWQGSYFRELCILHGK